MMAMRAKFGVPLGELLREIVTVPARTANPLVTGLALDSRRVVAGDCFVALAGAREHGLRHAAAAVAAGAVAVLTEDVDLLPALGVPVLRIAGLRARLGEIAARFYRDPSRRMTTIAVTGTLGFGRFGALSPSVNTTPDPLTLQREFAALLAAGCTHVALEASSHALVQGRLTGLEIGAAVFTGLGHDHLDFHGSLDAYLEAKIRLFSHPGLHTGIVNADDAHARRVAAAIDGNARCWRFSTRDRTADLVALAAECRATGSRLHVRTPLGEVEFGSALVGDFNVQNLLAALAALLAIGTPLAPAAEALSRAAPVRGRLELAAHEPRVYIDYAHSPDSLERVLVSLRALTSGRLICVFGCGGDRDATKRPLMGAIAERAADLVFITTDNARSEDPGAIAAAILGGMRRPAAARVELDRAAAIRAALAAARPDDSVLIAGKGHETTQTIGGDQRPFDDRAVVRDLLGLVP